MPSLYPSTVSYLIPILTPSIRSDADLRNRLQCMLRHHLVHHASFFLLITFVVHIYRYGLVMPEIALNRKS